MDEYASEGLEAYTNQIMAFLKVTYSKLEREADPNKKLKKEILFLRTIYGLRKYICLKL